MNSPVNLSFNESVSMCMCNSFMSRHSDMSLNDNAFMIARESLILISNVNGLKNKLRL